MSDAFLAERDAHCVRDADFARDARLRRVNGTHRITYHSEATSFITYLQANTHDFQLPSDCIDPESEDEDSCLRCHHLDDCFYAYSEELGEFDHMIYNGAYPICYAGCTYMYFLIINGAHKGEVWINNETSDFAPSKKSFGEFLQWVATAEVY